MNIKSLLVATTITLSLSGLTQAAEVNWGYFQHGDEPVLLPNDWYTEFPLCAGVEQSPIDIQNTVEADRDELDMEYKKTPLSIINNGHTIQVNYKPGSKVEIGEQDYQLLQFHFHTPSENNVNGQSFPMESKRRLKHTYPASYFGVNSAFQGNK